jgi:hypothetical protein
LREFLRSLWTSRLPAAANLDPDRTGPFDTGSRPLAEQRPAWEG